MMHIGYRLAAAFAVVGAAATFTGLSIAFSNADPKTPDRAELRDAVVAADKRGDNVMEIRKALDTLDKALAKGWTPPEPGKTVEPPAELVALHDAVEAAAKKGENVDEIRKQLEIVEKALIGKSLTKPKPPPPVRPDPIRPNPVDPFGPFPVPILPDVPAFPGAGIDREAMQKAQDLLRKALEMRLKDPDNAEAAKLMRKAQDMLMKAMTGGRGGLAPGLMPMPGLMPAPGIGRVPERFRLGVRLERVSELAADQLNLEVARGVGIADVVEGSPAAKAGFKTHDIVLEFAGKPVSDVPEEFTRLVTQTKGGKVDAVVMRKGRRVEIKGIELPDVAQAFPRAAIPADDELPQRERGALPEKRRNTVNIAVSENNGQITIKANQNAVNYAIEGKRNGNNIEVSKIVITDGAKRTIYTKIENVPEEYRSFVERALKNARKRLTDN